ncbi:hypothetical protein PGS1_09030 [Enterobacter cloacae subsp. cloacae GS1]|nr:hypothetical protein PGS1_09030 [Enterobacter cloacae subsp. cloacae GS1]
MVRRLVQLYVGLGLYGLSTAMFIRSDLGVDPWDVFHLGVAIQTGMSIGTVTAHSSGKYTYPFWRITTLVRGGGRFRVR